MRIFQQPEQNSRSTGPSAGQLSVLFVVARAGMAASQAIVIVCLPAKLGAGSVDPVDHLGGDGERSDYERVSIAWIAPPRLLHALTDAFCTKWKIDLSGLIADLE